MAEVQAIVGTLVIAAGLLLWWHDTDWDEDLPPRIVRWRVVLALVAGAVIYWIADSAGWLVTHGDDYRYR